MSKFYRPNKPFLDFQTNNSDALQCCRQLLMHLQRETKVQHMTTLMDSIFKGHYQAEMLKQVSKYSGSWKTQLTCMNMYWRKTAQQIDRDTLEHTFRKECDQLCLPEDVYDVRYAFKQAEDNWLGEIMVQVAENLVMTRAPHLVSERAVVGWNSQKQQIVISHSVLDASNCEDHGFEPMIDECDC